MLTALSRKIGRLSLMTYIPTLITQNKIIHLGMRTTLLRRSTLIELENPKDVEQVQRLTTRTQWRPLCMRFSTDHRALRKNLMSLIRYCTHQSVRLFALSCLLKRWPIRGDEARQGP